MKIIANDSDPRRPTAAEVAAARGETVPDLIAPGLRVLFCGINPSLYSAAVGHHFARPGNRFWPALHAGGFTGRVLLPSEGRELLTLGYGIVNIVDRATGAADELSAKELVEGARRLEAKVRCHRPAAVAFLGITAYRTAFGRGRAHPGGRPRRSPRPGSGSCPTRAAVASPSRSPGSASCTSRCRKLPRPGEGRNPIPWPRPTEKSESDNGG